MGEVTDSDRRGQWGYRSRRGSRYPSCGVKDSKCWACTASGRKHRCRGQRRKKWGKDTGNWGFSSWTPRKREKWTCKWNWGCRGCIIICFWVFEWVFCKIFDWQWSQWMFCGYCIHWEKREKNCKKKRKITNILSWWNCASVSADCTIGMCQHWGTCWISWLFCTKVAQIWCHFGKSMVRQVEPCNRLEKEYHAMASRDQTGNNDWRAGPTRIRGGIQHFSVQLYNKSDFSSKNAQIGQDRSSFLGSGPDNKWRNKKWSDSDS